MNRILLAVPLLAISSAFAAPRAFDPKVTLTTSYQSAELGGMEAMMMMPPWSNGKAVTIALKGERLATIGTSSAADGIVDFTLQKIFRPNPRLQVYTEKTFNEARVNVGKTYTVFAKPSVEVLRDLDDAPIGVGLPTQSHSRAKRLEFRVEVTEPGPHKNVANVDTREFMITVTAWERGKNIDETGGWVAASDVWLSAQKLAAVDALVAAERRYAAAIAGRTFDPVFTVVEMPSMAVYHSQLPEEAAVAARVLAEVSKLDGTVLSSSTSYGLIRNARDMKLLTSRNPGAPPAKILTVTKMTLDYLSIDGTATDADVSIPAGFKLKK